MKRTHQIIYSLIFIAALLPAAAHAGGVDLPNSFAAGTPAVAAEVNANFNAIKTAVDDNDARISDHDTRIGQLETQVAALEAEADTKDVQITQLQSEAAATDARIDALEAFIAELQSAMTLQNDAQGHPAVVFSGVNVHINNGMGSTETVNGRGNLIVGYNEQTTGTTPVCSNGQFTFQGFCESSGELWQVSHKSGSHNVVIGSEHNYSQYGGLIAGFQNTVNGTYAAVSGGTGNRAMGAYSSIGGGGSNTTIGTYGSVSGGAANYALGSFSSVSGGMSNSVNAFAGSISGGQNNTATGNQSSVSGGNGRTASGTDDWVAGGLLQDN